MPAVEEFAHATTWPNGAYLAIIGGALKVTKDIYPFIKEVEAKSYILGNHLLQPVKALRQENSGTADLFQANISMAIRQDIPRNLLS